MTMFLSKNLHIKRQCEVMHSLTNMSYFTMLFLGWRSFCMYKTQQRISRVLIARFSSSESHVCPL